MVHLGVVVVVGVPLWHVRKWEVKKVSRGQGKVENRCPAHCMAHERTQQVRKGDVQPAIRRFKHAVLVDRVVHEEGEWSARVRRPGPVEERMERSVAMEEPECAGQRGREVEQDVVEEDCAYGGVHGRLRWIFHHQPFPHPTT